MSFKKLYIQFIGKNTRPKGTSRSLQRWVSTIQLIELASDVFFNQFYETGVNRVPWVAPEAPAAVA